jgi:hypothetical protein
MDGTLVTINMHGYVDLKPLRETTRSAIL